MTVATTGVSVQQMRGRSLRLDPADPEKVASNWDVVCVAPDLVRGSADYERFVRKHLHLFAPAEDGEVEAGPSHVHPELGPFGPPDVERFGALNAEQLARAADRPRRASAGRSARPTAAWSCPPCWCAAATTSAPATAARQAHRARCTSPSACRSPAGWAVGSAFGVVGVAAGAPALLAGLALAPAGLAWAAVRLRAAKQRLPIVLPLDAAARAVVDAYRELDELSAEAAASLRIEPRTAGYLRCELRARRRRRASGSPPRSTSWSASPTPRATSCRGRWPIRAAGRSRCSAAC